MRLRHKQPTLVSMWMLDVFCCALGCVILLLLLKMREANITAEEATNVSSERDDLQYQLLDSEINNSALVSEVLDRDGRIARVQRDRDENARNLALVRNERDKDAKTLALARTERDDLAKMLALVQNQRDKDAK